MLPIKNTNDQSGCNPVSSNCVIWQGPDIPCIQLCHGDSISDVTAKLATELCEVLNLLDLTQYDISCFSPVCPAFTDFSDLVQFIINKLCELEACCNQQPATPPGCPDCILNIATCFQYINELGDKITTMQLDDYVTAIGNKVCTLEAALTALQATVANHEARITYIENNCCDNGGGGVSLTIPDSCLDPTLSNIPIDDFVEDLEFAFCQLQNATGTPSVIQSNITPDCFPPSQGQLPPALDPANAGNPVDGFAFANFATMAGSLGNAWAMICDLYLAVQDIKNNCCSVGCNDIDFTYQSVTFNDPNILVSTIGNIPSGFNQCGTGSQVTIIDAYGTTANATWTYDITGNPVSIPLPLTLSNSIKYNLSFNACITNGTETCYQNHFQVVNGNITCASLALAIGDNTDGTATISFTMPIAANNINYNLTATAGNGVVFTTSGSTQGVPIIWNTGAFLGAPGNTSVTVVLQLDQNGYALSCSTNGLITRI
jgi:hypothetical protein